MTSLQQPYGVFPPEIWLHILKSCSTTSLKNLSLTSKSFYLLSSDQLLHTLVLGQNTISTCVLPPSLHNATVIKDAALFNHLVLDYRHLHWYKAVKTVFVVRAKRLWVTRRSALPLICYYITWWFKPEDKKMHTWKPWVMEQPTVMLWVPEIWPVRHPIMLDLKTDIFVGTKPSRPCLWCGGRDCGSLG
ncbi:unnamed protein product [Aureobasidium mustum]|uniref:F-box domain-containing protein n=1 Tax=Aureobasidium mustum TaxID=2773714 RepID=A0A9N8JEV5_9PEZI|nr:unnamed protein product [Aureobasidium mustum]